MAPHSSTLAWKSHGRRSLVGCSHGVVKSRTRLSNFTFTFHFHALEKEMATHSGVLAWRIPGTGEPGGLPSMGSHRAGHDWSDSAAAVAAAVSVLCRSWWWTGRPGVLRFMGSQRVGHDWATELNWLIDIILCTKLLPHNSIECSSLVSGSKAKSSLEITNLTSFTVSYHYQPHKIRKMFPNYWRFLIYFLLKIRLRYALIRIFTENTANWN